MKAVLISIRPEWCVKITNGEKVIEVRRTRPKIETPFLCYIYCTKAPPDVTVTGDPIEKSNGTIIGEFICRNIFPMRFYFSDPDAIIPYDVLGTCLSDLAIMEYLGNGKQGYGWHISDLKIYDEPIPVTAFRRPCINDLYCESCAMFNYHTEHCGNAALQITRPPQSWCYVEELH